MVVCQLISGKGLDRLEAFRAYHVFHPAGILCSCFWGNAEEGQKFCEKCVPLVDGFRNFSPRFLQRDIAFPVHGNVAVFPKILHGDADAWLGIAQFIGDVDGTNLRLS